MAKSKRYLIVVGYDYTSYKTVEAAKIALKRLLRDGYFDEPLIVEVTHSVKAADPVIVPVG